MITPDDVYGHNPDGAYRDKWPRTKPKKSKLVKTAKPRNKTAEALLRLVVKAYYAEDWRTFGRTFETLASAIDCAEAFLKNAKPKRKKQCRP